LSGPQSKVLWARRLPAFTSIPWSGRSS